MDIREKTEKEIISLVLAIPKDQWVAVVPQHDLIHYIHYGFIKAIINGVEIFISTLNMGGYDEVCIIGFKNSPSIFTKYAWEEGEKDNNIRKLFHSIYDKEIQSFRNNNPDAETLKLVSVLEKIKNK